LDLPRSQWRYILQQKPDWSHIYGASWRGDISRRFGQLNIRTWVNLLTHEGPALKAQKEAAEIFGAEKTYFVLNGTSSSNKIALTNLITEEDVVLFDRNNHKAAHHGALLLGGGIPIFMSTARNSFGLIGPINSDEFNEENLREKIRKNPLVKDRDLLAKRTSF